MAFGFFREGKSGPREIACPLCNHRQTESPLAVSSYCKGCGAYLTFEKGKIQARPKNVENPFENRPPQKLETDPWSSRPPAPSSIPVPKPTPTPPPQPAPPASRPPSHFPSSSLPISLPVEPEPPASPTPPLSTAASVPPVSVAPEVPVLPSAPEPLHREEPEKPTSPEPTFRPPVKEQPLEKPSKKLLKTRKAICFECGDAHEANALSNSTQCRKCGRMISLQNHDIKSTWSSRLQTRGDVFIHKKGVVTGALIQCHHMTVEGDFTGSVECSGDLILRRHGRVLGNVTCDRLFVEKRAQVEFLNPVKTNECRIDGLVTGNITCRGKLSLEKKATLTGDIQVGTLTVADGARHSGKIQMGGF